MLQSIKMYSGKMQEAVCNNCIFWTIIWKGLFVQVSVLLQANKDHFEKPAARLEPTWDLLVHCCYFFIWLTLLLKILKYGITMCEIVEGINKMNIQSTVALNSIREPY